MGAAPPSEDAPITGAGTPWDMRWRGVDTGRRAHVGRTGLDGCSPYLGQVEGQLSCSWGGVLDSALEHELEGDPAPKVRGEVG